MTMPAWPREPSAQRIGLDAAGLIQGLFRRPCRPSPRRAQDCTSAAARGSARRRHRRRCRSRSRARAGCPTS
ncbi:MAG: hypothetical protein U1E17_07995 [Geminicoccaceae bacterium]